MKTEVLKKLDRKTMKKLAGFVERNSVGTCSQFDYAMRLAVTEDGFFITGDIRNYLMIGVTEIESGIYDRYLKINDKLKVSRDEVKDFEKATNFSKERYFEKINQLLFDVNLVMADKILDIERIKKGIEEIENKKVRDFIFDKMENEKFKRFLPYGSEAYALLEFANMKIAIRL